VVQLRLVVINQVAAALVGLSQVVSHIAILIGIAKTVVVKMENAVMILYLAEPGATSIPDLPQVQQLRKLLQQPILMTQAMTQRRDLHPVQLLMLHLVQHMEIIRLKATTAQPRIRRLRISGSTSRLRTMVQEP
jgi:hypothetical protein